ncbi:Nuclear receptor 2C2-associated protein [Mycoemilia scoparia]|uniref:Nuclear receptor 2C2-associated protein n=1 Tax=Mycoemilia scoparia TaxID=417184 RepID=A0A9W8A6V5_9FUNG|nr:Nuclear receptor 2C2-associated protein [Mycoemilia scoparia]
MSLLNVQKSRVSSVLNKDTVSFGRHHLFDGKEETCWNSEEGKSQFVQIIFEDLVTIESIKCQFQGGFAAKKMEVLRKNTDSGSEKDSEWIPFNLFHPQDDNSIQINEAARTPVREIKVLFEEGTDFFGRITMYMLNFFGQKLEETKEKESTQKEEEDNVITIF